ncbi:MAG: outer membrane beta-barrel protein [Luteolibacter sp.]
MKKIILMSLALAVPAFAGTEVQTYQPAPQPQAEPWSLTAGVSAAYLFDYEEVLYTGNIGVRSPWSAYGWNIGFFLEGGFMEQDNDAAENAFGITGVDADLKVVPITANIKLEKALSDQWGLYFGGGLGTSHTKFSTAGYSDSDWVFTSQLFAGVAWHLDSRSAIYAGGRFIHFDDAENYDLNSDYAVELGYRWNF